MRSILRHFVQLKQSKENIMAEYKVVITARSFGKADDKAYDRLRKAGCEWVKLNEADGPVEEQLRDAIKDADALIAGLRILMPKP